jgi:hypothetical protein
MLHSNSSSEQQNSRHPADRFLRQIPKGLGAAISSVEAASPSIRDAAGQRRTPAPNTAPPRVRLSAPSIQERAMAITRAANEAGRLHSPRATALYHFLVATALAHHLALRPGNTLTPSHLTFFLIADELPLVLAFSRATLYRTLKELKAGGLVDRRGWITSSTLASKGHGVTGGTVVNVVLTPERFTVARVRHEDLQVIHRRLDADRKAGRTAWNWIKVTKAARRQLQALELEIKQLIQDRAAPREVRAVEAKAEAVRQSSFLMGIENQIRHVLRWTFSSIYSTPVDLTVSQRQDVIYSLGELGSVSPQQRAALITERAQALCQVTGDRPRNLDFWRWLLWRAAELEQMQPGLLPHLISALTRLMTDLREWGQDLDTRRPLRSPGALFVSRLKASGWWAELKAVSAA